jgi:N-acetylglutamate synthase-like GNAT family acetyltransferase
MQVRLATLDDVPRISALIRSLSEPFFLSPAGEGADLFLQSIGESAVQGYVSGSNFCYQVAESEGQLIGVVAVRDNSHLYHLFVATAFQRQGIARQLWQLAKEQAVRAGNPGRFTVNSSLRAVPVSGSGSSPAGQRLPRMASRFSLCCWLKMAANQLKPTAPSRNKFRVFSTTPCVGFISFSLGDSAAIDDTL